MSVDLEDKILGNTKAINALQVESGVLKEKVSFFNVIYGKFDLTLGKIQEMIENRRYESNEDIKEVYDKLTISENRIMAEINKFREEMKASSAEQQKRLAEIDKWRWVVVGAAGAIGWFLNKIILGFMS